MVKILLGQSAPQPHLWTFVHLAEALVSLEIGVALYTFLLRIGVFGFSHYQTANSGQRHFAKYFSVNSWYNSLAWESLCFASSWNKPSQVPERLDPNGHCFSGVYHAHVFHSVTNMTLPPP